MVDLRYPTKIKKKKKLFRKRWFLTVCWKQSFALPLGEEFCSGKKYYFGKKSTFWYLIEKKKI